MLFYQNSQEQSLIVSLTLLNANGRSLTRLSNCTTINCLDICISLEHPRHLIQKVILLNCFNKATDSKSQHCQLQRSCMLHVQLSNGLVMDCLAVTLLSYQGIPQLHMFVGLHFQHDSSQDITEVSISIIPLFQ